MNSNVDGNTGESSLIQKKYNTRLNKKDCFIVLNVLFIGTLSVFKAFSNYDDWNQFGKTMYFSMGAGASNARYFFQVTLWNFWLVVVGYIVIYDMIINRWIRKRKNISPLEGLIHRFVSTLAIVVAFVFWAGMGVVGILYGNPNAYFLFNAFCLHFVTPCLALFYCYYRNKQVSYKENNLNQFSNWSLQKLRQGSVGLWFVVFIIGTIVFIGCSFLLQYFISTNYTPVYPCVDWHHGTMFTLVGAFFCLLMPFLFTMIMYLMHVDITVLQNKQSQQIMRTLKPAIFIIINMAMSFTLCYGITHSCVHLSPLPSLGISLLTVIISGIVTAMSYVKFFSESNIDATLFPRFVLNSSISC